MGIISAGLCLLCALPVLSQDKSKQVQLFSEVRHKKTIPLRDMKVVPPHLNMADPDEDAGSGERKIIARAPAVGSSSQAARASLVAPVNVTTGLNFDGIEADGTRATPDTVGAVGATQYVQWVNLSFVVFDKATGSLLLGPIYGNALWSALGESDTCAANDDGDIVVEYDRLANVWVMSQHAYPASGTAPFSICVAVSETSDATGSWNAYDFVLPPNFPDYPKLAVWPDAYYLSINEQNPVTFANLGGYVCALDRQSMLAGTTARAMQCFEQSVSYQSLLPSDLDGSIAPPSGAPNYFLDLGTNALNLWQFHVDWTTPANTTFSGPTVLPVTAFTKACGGSSTCVPQLGTTQLLDGIGDRLMFRVTYRHFADGHESLVASHTVSAPSGIRWYEIQSPGTTPEVVQQATFSPDSNYRWMPSIAMDQMGDIALGYSVSSSSMAPAIRYTGRLQSDPLNTMEAENSIIEGPNVEEGSNRWGDYSSMSIDPTDDCTFFYTNQYQETTGSYNWRTRIASFKFPSCTSNLLVTLSPSTLYYGSYAVGVTSPTQTVTLTNKQNIALEITSITPSGDFAETNTCGSSLTALGTCTITVSFTPTATGTRTGQVVIVDNASGNSQQVINLTGTGGGPVMALAQTSLSFGVMVKSSLSKSVKMTNKGSSNLDLNSIVASGDYLTSGTCTTITFLAASSSCTLTVTFTPSVTGSVPGVATINDNAPGSPHLVTLTGTGLPTLSVSPLSMSLGTVTVGSSGAAQTLTITNNATSTQTVGYSASGNFSLAAVGTTPCGASPTNLGAGAKCTVSVTFTPTQNGTIKGSVSVTDGTSGLPYNPEIVSLSGTGSGGAVAALSFQPASLSFGNIVVGNTPIAKTVTVKNATTGSITLQSFTASGDYVLSTSGQNICKPGAVLAAGLTCVMGITFTPTIQGSINGSVTITDNAAAGPTTQEFDLAGTGVWPLTLSPTTLSFGTQAVGTSSAPKTLSVLNYTASSVTLESIVASGDYTVAPGGTSPCGATVGAAIGQTPGSCTLLVTFTPANTGNIKGTVTIAHNASGNNSPQVMSLSGTGQ